MCGGILWRWQKKIFLWLLDLVFTSKFSDLQRMVENGRKFSIYSRSWNLHSSFFCSLFSLCALQLTRNYRRERTRRFIDEFYGCLICIDGEINILFIQRPPQPLYFLKWHKYLDLRPNKPNKHNTKHHKKHEKSYRKNNTDHPLWHGMCYISH